MNNDTIISKAAGGEASKADGGEAGRVHSLSARLHSLPAGIALPAEMNNPFNYQPHALCRLAAERVEEWLVGQPAIHEELMTKGGKMFGVLIVEYAQGPNAPAQTTDDASVADDASAADDASVAGDASVADDVVGTSANGRKLGFLAAYSGLLAGRNDWPFFVPPVVDTLAPDGYFKMCEAEISAINRRIAAARLTDDIAALRAERKRLSDSLQRWLFGQYQMLNAAGERKPLIDIFADYYRLHTAFGRRNACPPLPPAGAGDCCAPKLLQYAFGNGWRPVSIAEFWYGAPPKSEIRHHRHYYPACRGKCLPILLYMLAPQTFGMESEGAAACAPEVPIIYEDDHLIVVSKPAGLPSMPTKERLLPSLYNIMCKLRPDTDIFLAHRLDMDTSGLLLVAKNKPTYTALQRQFADHTVRKRYVALLDDRQSLAPLPPQGIITLPLYADPLDRPYQRVDHQLGKAAVTEYELRPTTNGRTMVYLYPKTGRTHQLRVHCAPPDGLGRPIVGDRLYGQQPMLPATVHTTPADNIPPTASPLPQRLCLHAEAITFIHPATGATMTFEHPCDF